MASPETVKLHVDSFSTIFKSLFKVFVLPSSLWMALAFFSFNICIGLTDALLPVFTIQEINWTNSQYSNLFSSVSMASGFLGMVIGGALADFFGKKRMIIFYLLVLVAVFVAMSFMKSYWQSETFVTGFMGSYYLLYTFTTIASFAIGMELCWCRVSATQFTLYMAIANSGRALGAYLLGPLKQNFPWEQVILSAGLFALASLFFVIILRIKKHVIRLGCIEADELVKDGLYAGTAKKIN